MKNYQLALEQEPSTAHVDPIYWDVYVRGTLQPVIVRARRWYDARQRAASFYGTYVRFSSMELEPSSPAPRTQILRVLEAQ